MVKVSTLFHRVDGFEASETESGHPFILDPQQEDQFLRDLLEPVVYDPGNQLVKSILSKL